MSSKVSGFATFVRLIGRSMIGGNLMKSIKTKSLFAILLSAFALSSCQDMPKVSDSLGSVPESSSSTQSVTCSGGTSVPEILDSEASSSITPEVRLHDLDNGVMVVMQADERIPLDGYSFRIDNLNEEFTLELRNLYIKGTRTRILRDVYTLFFADINQDGYLDFVYTSGDGRSRQSAGKWIGVYDYHNETELYKLDESGKYDYEFFFEDHEIVVKKYNTDIFDTDNVIELNRLMGKGTFVYLHRTIGIDWQNFLNIDSSTLSVTTADSARTVMPLMPSQPPVEDLGVLIYPDSNTLVIEHACVDKAYCITSTITRNSGDYSDLPAHLPVGYSGHALFKQAVSSNRQDNVVVSFLGKLDSEDIEKQSVSVGVFLDSLETTIIFKFDTFEPSPDSKTLKEATGWNFAKQSLTEFSHEYIPGAPFNSFSEEEFPFMYVSVANEEYAANYSYSLLEGTVFEIDPALVNHNYPVGHYNYKTNAETYTLNEHLAFLESGGSFYTVLTGSRDFKYALSNGENYYRFRDEHTEITAQKRSPSGTKVLENANKIIFKRETVRTIEERVPDYKLTIAGNTFEIMDYKTMIKGSTRYTAVSSYDFSSLYA